MLTKTTTISSEIIAKMLLIQKHQQHINNYQSNDYGIFPMDSDQSGGIKHFKQFKGSPFSIGKTNINVENI